MARRLIVEADGGSRGNPGPAAFGAVVRDADSFEVLASEGLPIGRATNNVAEYSGLIAGLEMARELDPDRRRRGADGFQAGHRADGRSLAGEAPRR